MKARRAAKETGDEPSASEPVPEGIPPETSLAKSIRQVGALTEEQRQAMFSGLAPKFPPGLLDSIREASAAAVARNGDVAEAVAAQIRAAYKPLSPDALAAVMGNIGRATSLNDATLERIRESALRSSAASAHIGSTMTFRPASFEEQHPEVKAIERLDRSIGRIAALLEQSGSQVADNAELARTGNARLGEMLGAIVSGQAASDRATNTLNRLTFVLVALAAIAAVAAVPVIIDGLAWIGTLLGMHPATR